MGIVLRFVRRRRHVRASTKSAAIAANNSAVRPASRAVSVRKIRNQYSAGILFLKDHLRAAAIPTPISPASAAGESHNAMTSRKLDADMDDTLGRLVLNGKGESSYDIEKSVEHDGSMPKDDDYVRAFQARVKVARDSRGWTQTQIAGFLGVKQDQYKQWETRKGSLLPHRLLTKFTDLTGCSMKWLLDSEGPGPARLPIASLDDVQAKTRRPRKKHQRAS
jgi:transcriptional regulator with XRE-family HTH domain